VLGTSLDKKKIVNIFIKVIFNKTKFILNAHVTWTVI
jgi:hypothetical protein